VGRRPPITAVCISLCGLVQVPRLGVVVAGFRELPLPPHLPSQLLTRTPIEALQNMDCGSFALTACSASGAPWSLGGLPVTHFRSRRAPADLRNHIDSEVMQDEALLRLSRRAIDLGRFCRAAQRVCLAPSGLPILFALESCSVNFGGFG